jgi:hypothetical protein
MSYVASRISADAPVDFTLAMVDGQMVIRVSGERAAPIDIPVDEVYYPLVRTRRPADLDTLIDGLAAQVDRAARVQLGLV